MDKLNVFPDSPVTPTGLISEKFRDLGIHSFQAACRYVRELPYGYNSDKNDLMILFKENMGTCTTKHAVIGTLAAELGLPVVKHVGIYRMTEEVVTGTNAILNKYQLSSVPMLHCFLVYDRFRVDLTEGNNNGKNRAIDDFLFAQEVTPNISSKDEYILYRKALKEQILPMDEFAGVELKSVLQAREESLVLLKENVK